ncbi:hypothetical protein TSUD_251110 [Trifolium subterraneum]|uniref:Uncharacterized protein n=1 Tax=Trifolium subterraneum TaxID=3900 RepID=A0A2Z6LUQ8_TRISU|nr:hypothetical protein TSUD_251110 [Trifolium subterraneum]
MLAYGGKGEPKEIFASADDGKDSFCNGKDGSCKKEDIVVPLEHVENPVEDHAKGASVLPSMVILMQMWWILIWKMEEGGARFEMQGEIKETVVSLAHNDEPVEEHERAVDERAVDQSISLPFSRNCWLLAGFVVCA